MFYSYQNFGYEGNLITVETDLRRGIPSMDIVGLSDGQVKETRERVLCALKNSFGNIPTERILVALSPCDLKKEHDMSLAVSLDLAMKIKGIESALDFMAVGEVELSGKIRQSASAIFPLLKETEKKFTHIFTSKTLESLKNQKIKTEDFCYIVADSLSECVGKICAGENGNYSQKEEGDKWGIPMNDEYTLDEDTIKAVTLATSSKINIHVMTKGEKGIIADLVQDLTPYPCGEEKAVHEKIYCIAGYKNKMIPTRIPHPTSSIEGIYGGGASLRPGEVSLSHGGVLVLEDTAEFKSSVLMMMRVPMRNHNITLSRAGRTTAFPCDFSLVSLSNACPCGNYGDPEKICLCSSRSVSQYQKKMQTVTDECHIVLFRDGKDEEKTVKVSDLRQKVERMEEMQRGRKKNGRLTREEIIRDFVAEGFDFSHLDTLSSHDEEKALQALLSLANYDGRKKIEGKDYEEYLRLKARANQVLLTE